MTSLPRLVRWGIVGTGNIARQFAEGLRSVRNAQLLAVGSRTRVKAEEFAAAFAVPRTYKSYEDLVDDKDIDVVYIATPNHKHQENCLLALEAGKAVLCEKPFAVDATEASEIIALARRKHLFCMEAMWMRFLPAMARLRGLLDSRAIGEICLVRADFGIPKPFAKDDRFFSREMGGGAMLNFGVYLVSFAFYLLGKPSSIAGQASFGPTGVDEQSVAILGYPGGALVTLTASIRNYLPCEAIIIGTHGEIRIHPPVYRPARISVTLFSNSPPPSPTKRYWLTHLKRNALVRRIWSRADGLLERLSRYGTKRYNDRFEGNGFNYEAAEVTRCLRAGELESRIMPLAETLSVMETIDAIRSHLEDQPRAAW